MEEFKQDIIRIGEEDEIIDIINKIKNVPKRTVTLVIPKGAAILQDVTNLKILQRKAEELGKDISISKAGISEIYHAESEAPTTRMSETKPEPRPQAAPYSKPVVDMGMAPQRIRRNDTLDLRKMNPGRSMDMKRTSLSQTRPMENAVPVVPPEPLEAKTEEPILSVPTAPYEPSKREIDEENYFEKLSNDKKNDHNLFKEALDEDVKKETGNSSIRRVEREELFNDRNRTAPSGKDSKFDFSYGLDNKKKKKKTILPTISARFFAVFILICVLTASLTLFFILPKASIAIELKKENVKGEFNFTLDKTITEIDKDNDKIPMQTSDVSSEKTQSFTATGKKQLTTKATGQLTILNECSTGDQLLVAGTRFLSKDSGKVFKIDSNVTVPGFTKPEDATVPGSKTVSVTAEDVGEAYNINATAFTIPKLQETSSWKYSCLYARSDKPMSGGSNKEVTIVSQDDLDKAQAALTTAAQDDFTAKSNEQKNDDLIYINDTNDNGVISSKSSAKVGDTVDKFDMTVSIKKSAPAIAKSDLETLVSEKLDGVNNFTDAKPVSGSMTYQIGDTTNKDQQLSVSVSAAQDYVFQLSQEKIKNDIAGKNKQELNGYFSNMNGVKAVSVNFWPFWVEKVPNSFDKINISLDISNSV